MLDAGFSILDAGCWKVHSPKGRRYGHASFPLAPGATVGRKAGETPACPGGVSVSCTFQHPASSIEYRVSSIENPVSSIQ